MRFILSIPGTVPKANNPWVRRRPSPAVLRLKRRRRPNLHLLHRCPRICLLTMNCRFNAEDKIIEPGLTWAQNNLILCQKLT
jgi:hypothetical protein